MTNRQIIAGPETSQFEAVVGNNVAPGSPRLDAGRPVVCITGSRDFVKTRTITAGSEVITIARTGGGVGLTAANKATVTSQGVHAFDVVGSSISAAYETTGSQVGAGKRVYITAGNVLTLSATDNTPYGVVDFFRGELSATDTAVRIGVTL